jgi:hypothetical protein
MYNCRQASRYKVKGCQLVLNSAVLLVQENTQLRSENKEVEEEEGKKEGFYSS